MPLDRELLRMTASIVFAAILLYFSLTFFSYSIALLEKDPPRVIAGIMAGLAGFVFVSASISILRDWLIVYRAAGERRENQH